MARFFLRIYQYCIALPILIVLTIITALLTLIGSPLFSHQWWGYYPPRIWAKCWCRLMFVKVEVRNREAIDPSKPYVFIANHQGAYDIFAIYGYLGHNFKWMMKKSLQNIPFVGVACIAAGHILVDRSSPSAIAKTMQVARKRLSNGMSLVIFPEGSRSANGKIQKFKRGAFKLATDFNTPIVPVTINGSYQILQKKSYCINPGKIILTIHEPIEPGNDMDAVMQQSYDAIKSALPQSAIN
ncbi:MAG: lysophospholipid acyltransferase family protein [Muribaculaceae bacterium]